MVLMGDERMTLLAEPLIKDQLKNGTEVIMIPQLTLEGLLEAVKQEVLKKEEKHTRGILLLVLAGLHGTMVKFRVPDECKTMGHVDMQEMVSATPENNLKKNVVSLLMEKVKKSVCDALGNGSDVIFFPVLPVDMANYNAIRAKQHFNATGHKLQRMANTEFLHYHTMLHYRDAIARVNKGPHSTVSLVPNKFCSKSLCRKFTDEWLQDGLMPTLDLVERYILPQLQHTIRVANALRFPQVVLVGDRRLGQVVTRQQAKGIEPCSFILQEQPGLRSLTADCPAVQHLSGLAMALIIISVSLSDFLPPSSTSAPDFKRNKCYSMHDQAEMMTQFLQEARRVDQMLRLVTYSCCIVTTHIDSFDDWLRNIRCHRCQPNITWLKHKAFEFDQIVSQENSMKNLNLSQIFSHDSQQGHSRKRKKREDKRDLDYAVLKKAACTLENHLISIQRPNAVPRLASITDVLQNPNLLAKLMPENKPKHKDKDKESTHSTCSSHVRSRDREKRDRSSSRQRSPGVENITSPASSPHSEKQKDLDSISSGEINVPASPCPSSINSPENFANSSRSSSSNSRTHTTQHTILPSQQAPSKSPSPKQWTASYQGSRERQPSIHRYPSPSQLSRSSRNRSRSPVTSRGRGPRSASPAWVPTSAKQLSYRRSPSRSRSPFRSLRRSVSRSESPRFRSIARGRRSISRRRSLSRGRRPLPGGRRSLSRGRSPSRGKGSMLRRSISRERSLSRGRRSRSRGRRSFSRGRSPVRARRSFSRGRRSLSRNRSLSRGRRSVSREARRSLSRGRRSISRGRRGASSSRE